MRTRIRMAFAALGILLASIAPMTATTVGATGYSVGPCSTTPCEAVAYIAPSTGLIGISATLTAWESGHGPESFLSPGWEYKHVVYVEDSSGNRIQAGVFNTSGTCGAYCVGYKDNSGFHTLISNVGNETSYTVGIGKSGTSWYIYVNNTYYATANFTTSDATSGGIRAGLSHFALDAEYYNEDYSRLVIEPFIDTNISYVPGGGCCWAGSWPYSISGAFATHDHPYVDAMDNNSDGYWDSFAFHYDI